MEKLRRQNVVTQEPKFALLPLLLWQVLFKQAVFQIYVWNHGKGHCIGEEVMVKAKEELSMLTHQQSSALS